VAGLIAYAVAKGFELADRPIFALGEIVSGHTLKHLVAAIALAFLAAMVKRLRSAPQYTASSLVSLGRDGLTRG